MSLHTNIYKSIINFDNVWLIRQNSAHLQSLHWTKLNNYVEFVSSELIKEFFIGRLIIYYVYRKTPNGKKISTVRVVRNQTLLRTVKFTRIFLYRVIVKNKYTKIYRSPRCNMFYHYLFTLLMVNYRVEGFDK